MNSSLEWFKFKAATLIQDGSQWRVQRQKGRARRFVEQLSPDIPLEMVAIPSGSFIMGAPESEAGHYSDELPQHEVTLESFFMGRYPITQEQWRVVASSLPQIERELDPEPSACKGKIRPVETVSWDDAVEFCARLSVHTEREYRLPTSAEWEYACRAGTTTVFSFGDVITTEVANYNGRAYGEGPEGEGRHQTTTVNHFGFANAFGLSDMHGNVDEWYQDRGHRNYKNAPTDGTAWIVNSDDDGRILRGGSWNGTARSCRSASLLVYSTHYRFYFTGCRVCCSAFR